MTGKITIRKATRDDAVAIHELHIQSVRELCKDHYSNGQISGWLDPRTPERYFPAIDVGTYFIAIEDSVIVGFGGARPGEVWGIYVLPDHTKEGIGSMLLRHAMEIAQGSTDKVVLQSTLNAVDFYHRKGFAEVRKELIRRGSVELPVVLMEFKSET